MDRMSKVFSKTLLVGNDDKDGHIETVVHNLPFAGDHLPYPYFQYSGDFLETL